MYAGDNKEMLIHVYDLPIRIPPEADSAKQAIHRVHHRVCTWVCGGMM